jgi:hypothetical protein
VWVGGCVRCGRLILFVFFLRKKQGLCVLFMPSFILCFYVLACLSTLTVSICIGVVGSGMLAYYALAEARAVGYLFDFFCVFSFLLLCLG